MTPWRCCGRDCFNGPETVEGAGCSVYFRSHGEKPQSFVASNHGFVEAIGDTDAPIRLQDADESGEVGWTTVNEDQTTCSSYTGRETLDADTAKSWKTCDHMPLTFSPDGKHMLATASHGYEGLGASSLTILDRASGKPQFTLRNNEKSQAAIVDMVWEDDGHVLAVVAQKLDWGIIRVGLDGSVELADKRISPDRGAGVDPLPALRAALRPRAGRFAMAAAAGAGSPAGSPASARTKQGQTETNVDRGQGHGAGVAVGSVAVRDPVPGAFSEWHVLVVSSSRMPLYCCDPVTWIFGTIGS